MDDHKEVSALIRQLRDEDRSAHEARSRADGLLSSFHEAAKADIAAAIDAYNADGRGLYLYEKHETKVAMLWDQGAQKACVTVDLGAFTLRASRRTLMPREAWDLDEDHLVGELRNWLGNHVLWLQGCHLSIFPPLDYDLMSADPEL